MYHANLNLAITLAWRRFIFLQARRAIFTIIQCMWTPVNVRRRWQASNSPIVRVAPCRPTARGQEYSDGMELSKAMINNGTTGIKIIMIT